MDDSNQTPGISDPTYQDRDIRMKPLVWSIVIVLAAAAFAMVSMKWLFDSYEARYNKGVDASALAKAERMLPEGLRLQVNEPEDLKKYKAWEDSMVNGYGKNEDGSESGR